MLNYQRVVSKPFGMPSHGSNQLMIFARIELLNSYLVSEIMKPPAVATSFSSFSIQMAM